MKDFNIKTEINKIKLIIFDLDNTIWEGVLSEENVELRNNFKDLLKLIDQKGIVSSICSKNDKNKAFEKLSKLGILKYFVFPSINWDNKGPRIKELISDMNLKEKNVLFIDDEKFNLEEASYFCPEIMVANEHVINLLSDELQRLPNSKSRIPEYRILEKKKTKREKCDSEVEFLMQSDICIKIGHDCLNNLERINTLLNRTNQLNFTKVRLSLDETKLLLTSKENETGYIEAKDKYGYYGIIGFYCLNNRKLKHFCFSCRCLGMHIEQYMYSLLGFPDIDIDNDTAVVLNKNDTPTWIKVKNKLSFAKKKNDIQNIPVIFKGPCDLEQVFSFLHDDNSFIKEFNFVDKKKNITIYQNTHNIVTLQSAVLSDTEKNELSQLPFYNESIFDTKLYSIKNGIIFWSAMPDASYGVYENNSTKKTILLGEWCDNLLDKDTFEQFQNNEIWNGGFHFSDSFYKKFKDEYSFCGRQTPVEIYKNYKSIIQRIDSSNKIYILLPSEKNISSKQKAYVNRNLFHIELNSTLRKLTETYSNVFIIELDKYATNQSMYTNNVNHFTKEVYLKLSSDIKDIIQNNGHEKVKKSTLFERVFRKIKKHI